MPDSKVDEAEAKVIPVKEAKFKFEKTGGETADADNIEDYLLILASNLGDPTNVLHKKAYASNRDNVLVALESTNMGDKNHTRIEKLISLYEGE